LPFFDAESGVEKAAGILTENVISGGYNFPWNKCRPAIVNFDAGHFSLPTTENEQ